MVLAALADDETVHAGPWREYPEVSPKLEWRALGTMGDLIIARFSLLQAGLATQDAKQP